MRRHLWLWPLVALILLAFVGSWIRGRMEGAMKVQLAGNLKTILAANTEALRAWAGTMKSQAELFAGDDRVRELTGELLKVSQQSASPQAALLSAPQNATLRAILKPAAEGRGFDGFVVLDTNFLVIASGREQLIGMKSPPGYATQLQSCLAGNSLVSRPFPSVALLPDADGHLRAGVPTMFAAAPIRATDGRIVALLGLRIVPEKDFARILATARSGESGETYAT